jgi:hypothetical protein
MQYTVNVKDSSFALGLNPPEYDTVLSFDPAGRMIGTYLRDEAGNEANYRRGYDNRIIKLVKDPSLRNKYIEELTSERRDALLERCFGIVDAVIREGRLSETDRALLERAARNGPEQLASQREQFLTVYGSVPILPPDQYRALVLQATRGCPFNDCEFCSFYRGCAFHVNTPAEFDAHMEAVRAFFGESIHLRHSIFLGDANAIVIPTGKLLDRMTQARQKFLIAPPDLPACEEARWRRDNPRGLAGFYGFLDGLSGTRKTLDDYRALAAAGLKRVYLGAESGCDEVLERVKKPCRRDDVIETVGLCKQAGIAIGLIFLAGVCEDDEALASRHVTESCRLIDGLPLDDRDIVYLSPYVSDRARTTQLPEFAEDQLARLQAGLHRRPAGPRIVIYDIRGFIY